MPTGRTIMPRPPTTQLAPCCTLMVGDPVAQAVLEVVRDRVDRVADVEERRDVDVLVRAVHALRGVRLDEAGKAHQLRPAPHRRDPRASRPLLLADGGDAPTLDQDAAVLDVGLRPGVTMRPASMTSI
jgi:hypothetical protein